MKRNIIVWVLLLNTFYAFSQDRNNTEHIPVKTPDASAFSKVSFMPINEYTGKTNITIPIYEIAFGGMKVPIQLSYNYGGVQVNSIASSVGTNWSLFAGGSIIRDVNGAPDYTKSGAMAHPWVDNGNTCFSNDYREGELDIYNVNAPGLNTSYITMYAPQANSRNIECKEIEKKGNKISMEKFHIGSNLNESTQATSFADVFHGEIISNSGYKYVFSNINAMGTASQTIDWVNGNDYPNPISNTAAMTSLDLTSITDPNGREISFIYSLTYTEIEIKNVRGVFSPTGDLSQKYTQFNYLKGRRLKEIEFDSGSVEFFYDFVRQDINNPNSIAVNNNAVTRILVKNNNGKIIKDARFSYTNRQSVENCTEEDCYRLFLDSIHFEDANGDILPGYSFNYNNTLLPKRYSYKQDFLGYYNGVVASPAPAIEGHYIPKTYHKPNSGRDSFLPISLGLSGYQEQNGNYSLSANETYAKAGILERITYPTGGYTVFESESNQFKYLNTSVNGGGLRIQNQKIFDDTGSLERQIDYEYTLSNGETSGTITYMPRFNNYVLSVAQSSNYGHHIFQSDMANQKLTNASFVGYSRVKVSEPNNGYVIKEYTTPNDYPNILGDWGIYYANSNIPTDIINEAVNNGCFPNMVTDNDALRGKLIQETVYSQNNSMLKKIENTYDYKEFESLNTIGGIPYEDSYGDGCDDYSVLYEYATIKIERNLVKQTKETNFLNGNELTNLINYEYEDEYPFIKQQETKYSDGRVYRKRYTYPYTTLGDFELVETTGPRPVVCELQALIYEPLAKLVEKNQISTPYLIEQLVANGRFNTPLINNELTIYEKLPKRYNSDNSHGYFFNETPFPRRKIISKLPLLSFAPEIDKYGNPVVDENGNILYTDDLACDLNEDLTEYIIHHYDSYFIGDIGVGNPMEISTTKESPHTFIIWGYNLKYPIAIIENLAYKDLPTPSGFIDDNVTDRLISALITLLPLSNRDDDRTIGNIGNEGNLREILNSLREIFPDKQVTTYTYDPLIGVTSITDPRGKTLYYHYDSFNRLEFVKDHDGNILSENQYNYKN